MFVIFEKPRAFMLRAKFSTLNPAYTVSETYEPRISSNFFCPILRKSFTRIAVTDAKLLVIKSFF